MGPADDILTSDQAYQGVVNSLRYDYTRTGVGAITVSLPWPTLEAKRVVDSTEAVLGPRARLAVFDHISSHGAVVVPIKRLVKLRREHDIPVLLEGAHAPGMISSTLRMSTLFGMSATVTNGCARRKDALCSLYLMRRNQLYIRS